MLKITTYLYNSLLFISEEGKIVHWPPPPNTSSPSPSSEFVQKLEGNLSSTSTEKYSKFNNISAASVESSPTSIMSSGKLLLSRVGFKQKYTYGQKCWHPYSSDFTTKGVSTLLPLGVPMKKYFKSSHYLSEYHRVSLSLLGIHWVSLSRIESHWVLLSLSVIESQRVSLTLILSQWLSMSVGNYVHLRLSDEKIEHCV